MNIDIGNPSGHLAATAGAIMRAAADRMSDLNDQVAREIASAHLTSGALGDLITKLIDQLDAAQPDPDLEDDDAEEDSDAAEDDASGEVTAPERAGGGFVFCAGDDEEPWLGAAETGLFAMSGYGQQRWGLTGTDDRETEHDGPADRDALSLEFGEAEVDR